MIPSLASDPTFLIFDFGDSGEAEQARRQVAGWARAFKLVYEQLGAVVVPGRDGVQVIVRLAFAPGEQLSFERWLERIPAEEPFDNAECRVAAASSPDYAAMRETFSRLTAQ